MSIDILYYILFGAYAFTTASWLLLYREVRALRGDVERLRVDLAFERGKSEGADHEARLTRLERAS